jgi:hypothetical protein
MKYYFKIGIIVIIIWTLVIGFAYDIEKKAKQREDKETYFEGFVSSQSGIISDKNGNIIKCNLSEIGKQVNGGRCMDISYIDQYGKIQSKQIVSIHSNYFIDPSSGILQPVPYGYMAKPNQIGIIPITHVATYDISNNSIAGILTPNIPGVKYTYQNYLGNLDSIVQYHDDYKNGKYAPDSGGLPIGEMWIKDKNGSLTTTSIFDSSFNNPLYYEPGSYKYGTKNYVPTYENSVYLSNLSNYKSSTTLGPILNPDIGKGFCNSNLDTIDSICSTLDSNTCSSTYCCNVIEGGKCVGGYKYGPLFPNQITGIINRDFYYYQGKCYGSCNR